MLTARPDRYPARVKRRLIFPPAYPSETRLRGPDEPPYLQREFGPINQLVDSLIRWGFDLTGIIV